MPFQTDDPVGTVKEGAPYDPYTTRTVGVVALARIMGVATMRISAMASEGLLPYKVELQGKSIKRKIRVYDVDGCLWLWLGGKLLDARTLALGHAEEEVDLTWAFDALMDGIGRVDRKAPSARALRLYLTAQNSEKRFDFLVDWGTKRMMNESAIRRNAILRARARKAAEAEVHKVQVGVSDGDRRVNPATAFLANRGKR